MFTSCFQRTRIGVLAISFVMLLAAMSVSPEEEAMYQFMREQMELLQSGNIEGLDVLLGTPIHYWIDLESRDQVGALSKLSYPTFFIQGGRDYQVTTVDLKMWKEALRDRDNVRFGLYDSVNHILIEGEGPSTPAEYAVPGYVLPQIVEDIVEFVTTTESD